MECGCQGPEHDRSCCLWDDMVGHEWIFHGWGWTCANCGARVEIEEAG